ncbi:DNA polymerase III [Tieghemostelium lacteum]|uniref:DNA polymerase III n=1 Tax=Tieghemostelium lacteum TaxID=361077 RepID=A0A151Z578_TIELA|nr:DNA polymerase III [Tieghemostelium lacteum]|eukprot:KYQ88954.1 DNA polymerase III [Tieghemostelium lacteum]
MEGNGDDLLDFASDEIFKKPKTNNNISFSTTTTTTIESTTQSNSNPQTSYVSPLLAQLIDSSINQINNSNDEDVQFSNSYRDDKDDELMDYDDNTQTDDEYFIPTQYQSKMINRNNLPTHTVTPNKGIDSMITGDNDDSPIGVQKTKQSTVVDDQNKDRKLPIWMSKPKPEIKDYDKDNFNEIKLKFNEKFKNKENSNVDSDKLIKSLKGFIEVEEPILKGRVICFDLETSGFGPDDSIIEIGGVELIDGCRTGAIFQSYAKPLNMIHPKAQEVHNLTSYLLMTCKPIQFVLSSFMDWVGDSPLIAHNLAFDRRMLIQELIRSNIEFNPDHKCFCTMRYFRKVYQGQTYSLDSVSQHLNINKILLRKTHGALVDSEILAIIYNHLVNLPSTMANLKLISKLSNNDIIQKELENSNNNNKSDKILPIPKMDKKSISNNNNENEDGNDNNDNRSIFKSIDHLVLLTENLEKCKYFYSTVLGLEFQEFLDIYHKKRYALKFGRQKINIHELNNAHDIHPRAHNIACGNLDLCVISSVPLRDVINRFIEHSIKIEEGPVPRTGANGPILSVYIRDPDKNLIEISEYL